MQALHPTHTVVVAHVAQRTAPRAATRVAPLRRLVLALAFTFCAAATFATPAPAHAQLFDTARVYEPLQLYFAMQPIYHFEDQNFTGNMHLGIGTFRGVSLFGRFGFGMGHADQYYGGGVKFCVLEEEEGQWWPNIAIATGGHWQQTQGGGLDVTLLFDKRWGIFNPYLGLDFDLQFAPNDTRVDLGTPLVGMRFWSFERIWFGLEGAWDPLQHQSYISLGFGAVMIK